MQKTDGTSRFCVDFRRVNALTKKDAQPLPHIDDTLDVLVGSCWFSNLDLASGYWQVEVDDNDREKLLSALLIWRNERSQKLRFVNFWISFRGTFHRECMAFLQT